MREPLRILWKFPCRGRKDMFFESLDSLNNNIRDRNNYHISLTLDIDDAILNNEEVIKRLYEYDNLSIAWGKSDSKIHAINRNFPDYDFDVVVCWSNDMFLTMYGADDIMRDYIMSVANTIEDFDFLIHFPEPCSKEWLNVLYVATNNYFNRFNYIYHPSYLSLWADNESMLVAQMLKRYHYIGVPGLYSHKNPAYSEFGIERDELFNHQQSLWEVDEINYRKRKGNNFDLVLINEKWQTQFY